MLAMHQCDDLQYTRKVHVECKKREMVMLQCRAAVTCFRLAEAIELPISARDNERDSEA